MDRRRSVCNSHSATYDTLQTLRRSELSIEYAPRSDQQLTFSPSKSCRPVNPTKRDSFLIYSILDETWLTYKVSKWASVRMVFHVPSRCLASTVRKVFSVIKLLRGCPATCEWKGAIQWIGDYTSWKVDGLVTKVAVTVSLRRTAG